jgi:DNA-3-methyladenine glycosylase II
MHASLAPVSHFTIVPIGPYSLAASASFIGGFTPAAHPGADDRGHLHLAFCVEGDWQPAGVCLTEADGAIEGDVFGPADPTAVRTQVARILSLDVDGTRFAAVGRADPVVSDLQRRFDYLRPVLFWSPYESLAWFLIGQRISMRQASRIKSGIARDLGPKVDVHGDVLDVFPGPRLVRDLEPTKGISDRKLVWLRAAADAALEGRLDAARLRSMDEEAALAGLRELPGVGPFTAEGVLIRGAGAPDRITPFEPRLPRAVAHAYGLPAEPTDAEIIARAEGWRPFRSWVMVLLRLAYARDLPGEDARLHGRSGRRPPGA